MVAYCRILFLGFSYNLGDVSCFLFYPDHSYWFPVSLFLPCPGADSIQSQGAAMASCPKIPGAALCRLPVHCCSSRLPCRTGLGASLPVAEVLINQAESHRGAPPIQAFSGGQSRTRANPFFILPGVSFLLGLPFVESSACAFVSLRAGSVCVWRGGIEGGGRPCSYAFPPSLLLFIIINNEILRPSC